MKKSELSSVKSAVKSCLIRRISHYFGRIFVKILNFLNWPKSKTFPYFPMRFGMWLDYDDLEMIRNFYEKIRIEFCEIRCQKLPHLQRFLKTWVVQCTFETIYTNFEAIYRKTNRCFSIQLAADDTLDSDVSIIKIWSDVLGSFLWNLRSKISPHSKDLPLFRLNFRENTQHFELI